MAKLTKEESKELTNRLMQSINEEIERSLQNEDSYKEYLEDMMECHKYSINNSLLLRIAYKKANPIAKTKKQWEAMSVHVTDDWKNYTFLLRPSGYDGFYRGSKWIPYSKATEKEKVAIAAGELKRYKGVNFVRYPVYDISQTDADADVIASEKLESAPKTYEMERVAEVTNMSVSDFLSCVKDEIDILAQENGIQAENMSAYKAGTAYLCGRRLGVDMQVNNFYLHKNLDKKGFSDMKKLTKLMVDDSQSIIDNLIENLGETPL